MNIKRLFIAKPVLILETLVLLFFAFNVGKEMYKRHTIAVQIKQLEEEIGRLDKNKNDLNSLLSYVKTDSFIEKEAREKLNLAKEGESLVLFPDGDVAGTQAEKISENTVLESTPIPLTQPKTKSNLVKWWQYFFEYDQLASK